MSKSLTIRCPSRLHFGMFAARGSQTQFGGVGVMVDEPAVEISCSPAAQFTALGQAADRVREFAARWNRFRQLDMPCPPLPCPPLPAVALQVRALPPQHAGLGVGTQLALGVAALLNSCANQQFLSAAEWALCVQRAQRSAVGTYGFLMGGLIVEDGRAADERASLSPLALRLNVPTEWRFLLLRPTGEGCSGEQERSAFASLPPTPRSTTEALIREAREELAPACAAAEFDRFAASLYRFGQLAGACFASVQGGVFNGPKLAMWADRLRRWGATGVGQSSWGPTLFAVCRDRAMADDLEARVQKHDASVVCQSVAPNNRGADLRTVRGPHALLSSTTNSSSAR